MSFVTTLFTVVILSAISCFYFIHSVHCKRTKLVLLLTSDIFVPTVKEKFDSERIMKISFGK